MVTNRSLEKSRYDSPGNDAKSFREKPMVILNQTELFALEDIVNDIPEKNKRSLRRKVKKIITYPFKLKVRVRVD